MFGHKLMRCGNVTLPDHEDCAGRAGKTAICRATAVQVCGDALSSEREQYVADLTEKKSPPESGAN